MAIPVTRLACPANGVEAATSRDPVCGMMIDVANARHHADHDGHHYHFCSDRCRTRFLAEPARFIRPDALAPAPKGALYTCPMHPEIRVDRPGACPVCGMALEPVEITADDESSPELRDMTRRLWIGGALTVPLLVLDMAGDDLVPPGLVVWLELALATPVVLWAGLPLFARGLTSVRLGSLNMFSLVSLGVGAAYLYSVVATLLPGAFPVDLRDAAGRVPVYDEAAAAVTVLVLLGQVLELHARAATGSALRALLRLAPRQARRIRDGGADEAVPIDRIRPGDRLRIRPGEAVPVDGLVLDGHSGVDESLVTGEAMPVEKRAGSALIGGTLNGTGSLVMRAERVGADTMLAKIVRLVAEAQRSRAPIQRLADLVSARFVPVVIAVAVLAGIAWLVFGPPPTVGHALVAAVSVLIIACPCALGLATPMSIMVGIGKGAASGVLIRDAEALERLERVDTLVVDKTGTLTEGRPAVTEVAVAAGFDERQVLGLAAGLERASEHPLAAAFAAAARERALTVPSAVDFASIAGEGVTGRVDGRSLAVGNAALLVREGVDPGALAGRAAVLQDQGTTVLFVAIDRVLAGMIAVADPIKASTPAALKALTEAGIRIVMLTGDASRSAAAVAAHLGITEVHAGMLPGPKRDVVRRLQAEGRVVAMAGDGVNDAPALAEAAIGIAMGTGTDVAIASAAVTLVRGDLLGIVKACRLSRATMRNIRQNLAFAFVYNLLGVPVAAGLLYPITGRLLDPALAALAMSLSSVSVIANALRLRRLQL